MPRKPTGRPTGRPRGTGQLGLGIADEQERLSIRIPRSLYVRFEAYAAGRSFHRGSPQLARYVREAMEAFLARDTSREPPSAPPVPIPGSHEATPTATRPIPGSHEATPPAPLPDRATVVRRIRELRQTMSADQVAEVLNTEGVPTLGGKGRWYRDSVTRVAKLDA